VSPRREDRKAPADRRRQRQRKSGNDTQRLSGQMQHHAGYTKTEQTERRIGQHRRGGPAAGAPMKNEDDAGQHHREHRQQAAAI
jgi:hypothetical protein